MKKSKYLKVRRAYEVRRGQYLFKLIMKRENIRKNIMANITSYQKIYQK